MSDLEVFLGRPGTPASEGLEQDSALLASDSSMIGMTTSTQLSATVWQHAYY